VCIETAFKMAFHERIGSASTHRAFSHTAWYANQHSFAISSISAFLDEESTLVSVVVFDMYRAACFTR
jgi:hypothetical protein